MNGLNTCAIPCVTGDTFFFFSQSFYIPRDLWRSIEKRDIAQSGSLSAFIYLHYPQDCDLWHFASPLSREGETHPLFIFSIESHRYLVFEGTCFFSVKLRWLRASENVQSIITQSHGATGNDWKDCEITRASEKAVPIIVFLSLCLRAYTLYIFFFVFIYPPSLHLICSQSAEKIPGIMLRRSSYNANSHSQRFLHTRGFNERYNN